MNKNKNFFDEMSGEWEDLLSNTYEKHNNVVIQDKENDITLTLDNTKDPNITTYQDNYQETYTSKDGDFLFDLSVSLTRYGYVSISAKSLLSVGNEAIHFSLVITDTAVYNDEEVINVVMYEDNKTYVYSNEVAINPAFLKEFLDKAKHHIKPKEPKLLDSFIKLVLNSVPIV